MTDHLIILAGGASSRMKKSSSNVLSKNSTEQANSRSKALILINDRPMLDYVLSNAKQAGFKNIYIVVGKDDVLFKTYYGKQRSGNTFHGVTISFVYQHIPQGRIKPFGTADAVCQALEQYSNLQKCQFVVCNCDNLYSVKAFELLRKSTHSNAFINYDRDALQYSLERIQRFALTKTTPKKFLVDIIEKPQLELLDVFKDDEGKFRVSMNIFLFDGIMFYPFLKDCKIHPKRNEKELPTAILKMIEEYSDSMQGIPLAEHVPDLTAKTDIHTMKEYLLKHEFKVDWSKK
jgi:glucose-1-phosphate adenylyltransferase|tara:strand:- start:5288 stop:6157 length:870 start_codon:yes stop_codon:yes gene_type:complete